MSRAVPPASAARPLTVMDLFEECVNRSPFPNAFTGLLRGAEELLGALPPDYRVEAGLGPIRELRHYAALAWAITHFQDMHYREARGAALAVAPEQRHPLDDFTYHLGLFLDGLRADGRTASYRTQGWQGPTRVELDPGWFADGNLTFDALNNAIDMADGRRITGIEARWVAVSAPVEHESNDHIDLSTEPPFDFDAEEKRQRLVALRGRYLIGSKGLVQKFEDSGDPLIELGLLATLAAGPGLTPQQVTQRLVLSAELGAFPVPGTGFRYYGDRRAVRDLLDLYSFMHPVVQPASGQYALRPSLYTVQATPGLMRARRSVWVRWLTALGWPVPPELRQPDTLDADYVEPDDRGDVSSGTTERPPQEILEFIYTAEVEEWQKPGHPVLTKTEVIEACWAKFGQKSRRGRSSGISRADASAAFEWAVPRFRQLSRGAPKKVPKS
jgi:hypothetical protein